MIYFSLPNLYFYTIRLMTMFLKVLYKVNISAYTNLNYFLSLIYSCSHTKLLKFVATVKPLNSGHLRVLNNLYVIKRCPLLWGSSTKIVTFGTKYFVRYSRHVRYLGCRLLWGFTLLITVRLKGGSLLFLDCWSSPIFWLF